MNFIHFNPFKHTKELSSKILQISFVRDWLMWFLWGLKYMAKSFLILPFYKFKITLTFNKNYPISCMHARCHSEISLFFLFFFKKSQKISKKTFLCWEFFISLIASNEWHLTWFSSCIYARGESKYKKSFIMHMSFLFYFSASSPSSSSPYFAFINKGWRL